MARQAETDGDWKTALEVWQAIIKERPDDFGAYNGIRRSLISLSRFDEALAFIDKSIQSAYSGKFGLDPATMTSDKIEVLFAAGRDADAMAEIERQIKLYRGSPDIYRNVANVLFSQRHGDEAIALLYRGRNEARDPTLFSRDIARFAEARMDWANATSEYLLSLEANPEDVSYVTGTLGDIMLEADGDTLVLNAIDKHLLKTDRAKKVLFLELKAGLLFRSRQYGRSLDTYRELEGLRGSDRKVLLEIAQKLSEENELNLALTAYNEFLKGDVDSQTRYRTFLKIARTCENLAMIDSAEAYCKLVLNPGAPIESVVEANYLLGKYSIQRRHSPAEARNYLETALSLSRKSNAPSPVSVEQISIAVAMTWQLEGKFDQAKKELDKVVRLAGARANAAPVARFELARLAFRQGNIEEARREADALLMADASSEMSNEVLELVALLDGLKKSPEVLRLFGQADMLELLGKSSEAISILDSLGRKGETPRIAEEAIWLLVDLRRRYDKPAKVIEEFDRLIALEGDLLRKDKALYEAGVLAQAALGNPTLARKYYDALLIDYPDSPLAERARKLAKIVGTDGIRSLP